MCHMYAPSIGKTMMVNPAFNAETRNTTFAFLPDPASAINVQARQIYADIRKTNSGAKNYDATDVIMYLYSIIEA